MARALQPRLADSWGQPVVIDVRSGGGGVVATDHVAKAAPDGYTLLQVNSAFSIAPSVYPNLPYDNVKDFAPIAKVASMALPPSRSTRARPTTIASRTSNRRSWA